MRIAVFTCICVLWGCSGKEVHTSEPPVEQKSYLTELKTRNDVKVLEAPPVDEVFSGVVEIKVVYEIEKQQLYFVNGRQYLFHEDFCASELGYWQGNYQFNKNQYYENKKRSFLLAKLLYFKVQKEWVLEFIPSDMIQVEQVQTLLAQVQTHSYFGKEVRVLVHREGLYADLLKKEVPLISEAELYAGMQYQALNKGVSYGYLRRVSFDSIEQSQLGPKDILVTNGTPNDVPPLAGMLTSHFQTPLSHISILCKNRGTPLAAFKQIKALELNELWGQPVKFAVRIDTLWIEKATKKEVEEHWEKHSKKRAIDIKLDTSKTGIIPLKKMSASMSAVIGAKAANFGSLHKAILSSNASAKTPEGGFAIPISYYFQHLQQHHLKTYIVHTLGEIGEKGDAKELLKRIRDTIEQMPINQALLALVDQQLEENPEFRKWRFRSSTNAEDLKGFNGAGLYSSKSAHLDSEKKTVERAIKKVWASCWSERAFLERSYYQIDHWKVGMGILVHRSFPDEKANGVIISANLYDPNNAGIVINVQLGEASVVAPDSGVVCEQVIYTTSDYLSSRPLSIQYISKSSLTNGALVLSEEDLKNIAEAVGKVKEYFFENVDPHWSGTQSMTQGFRRFTEIRDFYDFALDIEFKIEGDGHTLYLKQVRPYR